MASTTLILKGSKIPSPIYLRFTESRQLDLTAKTGLHINPKFWDKQARKIRNVIDVANRVELNSKLLKLQITVIDQYNADYAGGVLIDKEWLEKTIKTFFNRPLEEVKKQTSPHEIYLSDFADWWLVNKAPTHKVKANKYMDKRTIQSYQQVADTIVKFEGKKKIRLAETTSEVMDSISQFMSNEEKYSEATTKRKITRVKFFCKRAESEGLKVHKGYEDTVFVTEEDNDYKHPYLNPEEINAIFKLDLSHDKDLDTARDNLIVGVWTGLRVGDFLSRLSMDNIHGDFISIKTSKTGHMVSIPIHPMVQQVLKKHNGLPPKMADQKFNDKIKIVGMLADVDMIMKGAIVMVDEKTKIKRKVVGLYKKHELITSHICRRSFATNHHTKIPNKVIMDIAGWKKEEMLLKYIKATNMESALVLKKYWENQYN